jgi:hypothetical protein
MWHYFAYSFQVSCPYHRLSIYFLVFDVCVVIIHEPTSYTDDIPRNQYLLPLVYR